MNKVLYQLLGGSHLYGLNNEESDVDVRYVYLNTDVSDIIGLGRSDVQNVCNDDEDKLGYEIRKYFNVLKKGNPNAIEWLYADKFIQCAPQFRTLVLDEKERLIDSEAFFKALDGYAGDEYKKALGLTQKHMGTRKDAIAKYGYSNRNASHMIRLMFSGRYFFQFGDLPVNIKKVDYVVSKLVSDIKSTPEKFSKEDIDHLMLEYKQAFLEAHRTTLIDFKFDEQYADEVILHLYYPILSSEYWKGGYGGLH